MTNESLNIACRFTGIMGTIDLPSLHGKALEYTHPLCHIESVYQVIRAGKSYLHKLNNPILAGIIITQLKAYGLYYAKELEPAAINANISRYSKRHLIAIIYALDNNIKPLYNINKAINVPKLNMDEKVCMDTLASLLIKTTTFVPDSKVVTEEELMTHEEVKLRRELREQERQRVVAEVKELRAKKEEARQAKVTAKRRFTLTDLDNGVVQAYIDGKDIKLIQPALVDLFSQGIKQMRKAKAITLQQSRILHALEGVLFTLPVEKRSAVIDKLKGYTSKYANSMIEVLKLSEDYAESETTQIEQALTTLSTEPKLSLRDKLKAMREARNA